MVLKVPNVLERENKVVDKIWNHEKKVGKEKNEITETKEIDSYS